MKWCQDTGKISIGDNAVISPNSILYGCGSGGIEIGKNFDAGPGVVIAASRTDYTKGPENHLFAPVIIGDEVTLFAKAVISPGVTIGNRAAVAACSVVTSDVQEGCLVGGAPARVLRSSIHSD